MSKNDFDFTDKSSLVVKPVQAIAVYINVNGDIAIRQECAWDGMDGDDGLVVVPVEHVPAIIKALEQAVEDLKGIEAGGVDSGQTQ